MELEKFERQLRLLVLLTQNKEWSVEQLGEKTGLNRRTIYRYLEVYKRMGFVVEKSGTKYRIDRRSPFFNEISQLVHFTEDEAMTIHQILSTLNIDTPQVRHLRDKLAHLYDFEVLRHYGVDEQVARNLSVLYQGVKLERVCLLRQYSSPNSGRVSDRLVEPYRFLDNNNEVRCYEIASGVNKTFKVARAATVELLDFNWSHRAQHQPSFTDLFHFSGEKRMPVRLLLGQLATNVLLEEFPLALQQLTLQADGRQLLQTEVCNYKGIGRFVLGLLSDIEVVDSPDFVDFLQKEWEMAAPKLGLQVKKKRKTTTASPIELLT